MFLSSYPKTTKYSEDLVSAIAAVITRAAMLVQAESFSYDFSRHSVHTSRHPFNLRHVIVAIRIDAELIDDLERILAPVLDVDEGVVQRRTVIANEAVALAKCAGGGEDIGRDDLVN